MPKRQPNSQFVIYDREEVIEDEQENATFSK